MRRGGNAHACVIHSSSRAFAGVGSQRDIAIPIALRTWSAKILVCMPTLLCDNLGMLLVHGHLYSHMAALESHLVSAMPCLQSFAALHHSSVLHACRIV